MVSIQNGCVQHVIGEVGAGFGVAMTAFNYCARGRRRLKANALGVAQRALHEATRDALERKTIGWPADRRAPGGGVLTLADMAIGIAAILIFVREGNTWPKFTLPVWR